MVVKVVTDSGSDINREEAQKLGITIVPIYLRFGNEVYKDGINIDSDEFYRKLASSPITPSTAAPSPGDFARVYEDVAKETREIVSIHVTSKHSSIYESALLGKESVEKKGCHVETIDSKGVTMWQGFVVLAAARAANAGASLKQVVNKVHETINNLHVLALLDTLIYLIKGGRLGKIAPAISKIESILPVKILLTLHDGEIRRAGLARSQNKGIEKLREFARTITNIEEAAKVHSCKPDEAKSLADDLMSLYPHIVPRIVKLGPVLGVHSGPGALITVLKGTQPQNQTI